MKATLTYHSIDDSGSPISLSAAAFAAHRRWLSSGRVRVLSLDDLAAHPSGGDDAVAVTFDDGFLNTLEPLESLRSDGVPVTLCVVSGHVGGTNAWRGNADPVVPTFPLLAWSHLEHLVARGVDIAAHTRTHRRLTQVPPTELDDELQGSLEDLHARLGVRPAHIVYPFGDVDDAVRARSARHFRWGHTTDFRVVDASDPATALPRLDVYYFGQAGALETWGTKGFTRRLAWIRARRAIRARLVGP